MDDPSTKDVEKNPTGDVPNPNPTLNEPPWTNFKATWDVLDTNLGSDGPPPSDHNEAIVVECTFEGYNFKDVEIQVQSVFQFLKPPPQTC